MDNLRNTQRAFATALFDRGRSVPSAISQTKSGAAPVRRFAVYRNNVVMSLTDVLEAYFPVVLRLVGEEFFRAMARAFILACPPASPVLSRYGEAFPNFVSTFEPVADLPYLADVARLEWAQQRAYHAADAKPLSAEELSKVPAQDVPELHFGFHPAAQILSSPFPIFSIWRTNTFDVEVEHIPGDAGSQAVLVVRPQLEVQTLLLADGAYEFIDSLMAGANLMSAWKSALVRNGDFELPPTLTALFDLGALVSARCRIGSRASPRTSGDLA